MLGGREAQAAVTVEPAPLTFQLLSQNDKPYPLPSAGGAVMVSRFPTDLALPVLLDFTSTTFAGRRACADPFQIDQAGIGCNDPTSPPGQPPPNDQTADLYTLRHELTGLNPGANVEFKMTVLRPLAGGPPSVIQSETYAAVGDGAGAYRGDRSVRFVSNTRPESAPSSARYDDAIGSDMPDQTPVVRLGDIVRFEALVEGVVARTLDYTVGRPASETGPLAERRVTLNWRTSRHLDRAAATDEIADRASEDWAQAAISVVNKPAGQRDALWGNFDALLSNVIELYLEDRGAILDVQGTFTLPVQRTSGSCSRDPSVTYSAGSTLHQLRDDLIAEIQSTCGLRVAWTPNAAVGGASNSSGTFVDPADATGFYLTIGAAHEVSLSEDGVIQGEVVATRRVINTRRPLSLPALGAVAAALRDDDPATVDVIALPKSVLRGDADDRGSSVLGFGFDDSRTDYPLYNVLFVGELNEADIGAGFRVVSAVDAYDDFPFVVGHELGHVLAGGGHPNQGGGTFGVVSGHPLVLRHIMATTGSGFDIGSPEVEFVGGPKRMNESFITFARRSTAAQLRGSDPSERQLADAPTERRSAFANQ